jgi:hypothetical protein
MFDKAVEHKYDKYSEEAKRRGQVFIPVPVTVHGGIDSRSCPFIRYLIQLACERRFST